MGCSAIRCAKQVVVMGVRIDDDFTGGDGTPNMWTDLDSAIAQSVNKAFSKPAGNGRGALATATDTGNATALAWEYRQDIRRIADMKRW